MKKNLFALFVLCTWLPVLCAHGAPAGTDRRSLASQQWGAAPRVPSQPAELAKASIITGDVPATLPPALPTISRDAEKRACMNNNIGAGNTFVWASKFSNTNEYSSMVEDVEFPENNTCFVRVELKSSDAKINVSDIRSIYYEMGRIITCGDWADKKKIESRILDAKKSARTWGTVAGVVGGAGVGVGAMELFGNELIGGSVEGQFDKSLIGADLLISQLKVAKDKKDPAYDFVSKELLELKNECEKKGSDGKSIWIGYENKKPDACTEYAKAWDYVGAK